MKFRIMFVAAILLAALAAGARYTSAEDAAKDAFFINLTTGRAHPHKVHMALELGLMAQKQGKAVTVFFNVDGPQVASVKLPNGFGAAKGEVDVKGQIAALKKNGATLLACPHCMHVSKVVKEDLQPGIEVSTPEKLFPKLAPGTVSISY